MTTWNSDLLSKGSIFTCTLPISTSPAEPTSSKTIPARNAHRQRGWSRSGPITR